MTTESSDSPLRLGSVTIRNITAFQAELAELLDASGPVQIDGSGVERVDTATLQLLVAFVRELRAEARAVQWVDCSAVLRRAASSLGLESALSL
jgi:anti-anti-sigma regulatory factor